jgi:hypothetical protein
VAGRRTGPGSQEASDPVEGDWRSMTAMARKEVQNQIENLLIPILAGMILRTACSTADRLTPRTEPERVLATFQASRLSRMWQV